MFLRLFRSFQPLLIALVFILGLLSWLITFSSANTTELTSHTYQMPLYQLVYSWLNGKTLLAGLVMFVLFLLQAVLLNRLNIKFMFMKIRTYLPAMTFVLLLSGFLELQWLNPAFFASIMLLFLVDRFFDSYRKENLSYKVFEAGIFLSIGSLFYANMLYLVVFLWISLIILRPFNWREWFFTIIGVLLPYFFAFVFYYVFRNEPAYVFTQLKVCLFLPILHQSYSNLSFVLLGYIGFLVLLSTVFMVQVFRLKKIHSRKFFALFYWLLVLLTLIYLFSPSVSIEIMWLAIIPLAYIVSHYFALSRKTGWANIFLLLLIVVNVCMHIYQLRT